jgi:hypothetical protein
MFSKREAAEFLSISPRSLERYTRQGRIRAHYQKGRGHPVPIYEEGDLEALKADLGPTLAPPSGKATATSETVSFRLDKHYRARLIDEGEKRGISAGAYARLLVIDTLEDGEHERLRTDLGELRRLVALLSEDLATAAMALLLHGGRVEQEAEAREWVIANLRAVGGGRKE